MTNSVDPDQTAPMGAVCSGSTLFASILNSSVMLGNYLQQTTSADNIFRCFFSWRFYMSSHDLLNLLNELRKAIKCEACRPFYHYLRVTKICKPLVVYQFKCMALFHSLRCDII